MKRRDTVEVICGGVIGPIDRREVVIAGRYRGGDLVVGRTVPLTAAQSTELGAMLRPMETSTQDAPACGDLDPEDVEQLR